MERELLVFGANGALGKGVTKVLSQKDFGRIYLFDFDFQDLDFKDSKILKIKVNDLSKEENVINAFSNLKPNKDTYYFLFSTIGGFWGGQNVWEMRLEDWQRMFELNLTTNYLIAKHFSWIVKASAGGSACFTAAYVGEHPEALKSAYGASKGALVHLIKTLSLECSQINLSVNGIAPYIIDTPANRKWMPDADFNKWIKPEEIGEVVYSLFTNFNYVSGNILTLNERFDVFDAK